MKKPLVSQGFPVAAVGFEPTDCNPEESLTQSLATTQTCASTTACTNSEYPFNEQPTSPLLSAILALAQQLTNAERRTLAQLLGTTYCGGELGQPGHSGG